MGATVSSGARRAVVLAVALYALWVLTTYLLEGRVLTLQRPEATGARLAYALVANILMGIGGSILVIRSLSRAGTISARQAGFRGLTHAAVAVLVGALCGIAVYAAQGAPSSNPVVVLNAYAQVLVTSVAEVLVCWAVIGSAVEALLRHRGKLVSVVLAAIISSVLFGVYHFAHSPPFNTVAFVVLLTIVGLGTSLFFFISRDVYGTIAFHNFLGIFGVIQALDAAGALPGFERPSVPLLVMAVASVALLVAAHVRLISGVATRA